MRLPTFIFLIGPSNCGKTTLATLLCEKDNSIAHCSFDEPIREATLQIFYPDQLHIGIDLREDDVLNELLPFSPVRVGTWMENLRGMIAGISPTLIGDLAKKRMSHFQHSFQHFIYDDTQSPDEIKPFALAYGPQNCKLIFIERQGKPIGPYLRRFDHTFIPRLLLSNIEGKPSQMLERLDQMLPSDLTPYRPGVSIPEPPEPKEPHISEL